MPRSGTRGALLRTPRSAHVGHFSGILGLSPGGALTWGTSPNGSTRGRPRGFEGLMSRDRWARSGRVFRSPLDASTTEGTRSPPACRSRAQTPYPRGPEPCLGKGSHIRVSLPGGCGADGRTHSRSPMGVRPPMVMRGLTARGLSRISRTVLRFQGSAWGTPWWLGFAGPRGRAIPWFRAGRHFRRGGPVREVCASRRTRSAERESFWRSAHESHG